MPKQFAKAVEARERKESAKQDARSKQEKEKEDAYWASAGEGAKSKAAAKRDEQEKQRQEAAAKRAEAKRLADEEMEALSRPKSSKTVHKPTSKVKKEPWKASGTLVVQICLWQCMAAHHANRPICCNACQLQLVHGNGCMHQA